MSGYLSASETIESESCLRFLPVMITRLLLSLRKASAAREHGWDFGGATTFTDMGFPEPRSSVSGRDDIRLDILTTKHEGTQSWR